MAPKPTAPQHPWSGPPPFHRAAPRPICQPPRLGPGSCVANFLYCQETWLARLWSVLSLDLTFFFHTPMFRGTRYQAKQQKEQTKKHYETLTILPLVFIKHSAMNTLVVAPVFLESVAPPPKGCISFVALSRVLQKRSFVLGI